MRSTPPTKPRNQFHYSLLKILSGSDLSRRRLPYMEARAAEPGPAAWLTACAHGDEVGGMVVVQEIFKRLRKRPLLRGSLHAFPLMNPLGFEAGARHVTMSEEDLNRSFPGNAKGTLAERIAEKIFAAICETQPKVVMDLHNDWIGSIPYAVLDPPPLVGSATAYDKTAALAGKTGLPVVAEPEAIRHSLSHSLLLKDVPAMTVELGESYVVNERFVETGVKAVWAVLAELQLVEPDEAPFLYPLPAELQGRTFRYSSHPTTSTSGVLRFLARPGDIVRGGQPVAKVFNAFGRLQETLSAPADALVLGKSDSSVAFPGAPVMAFGLL
jgi:predicted deacylase